MLSVDYSLKTKFQICQLWQIWDISNEIWKAYTNLPDLADLADFKSSSDIMVQIFLASELSLNKK